MKFVSHGQMELTLTAALTDTRYGTVEPTVGHSTSCPCTHAEGFDTETFDADMTLEPLRAIRQFINAVRRHAQAPVDPQVAQKAAPVGAVGRAQTNSNNVARTVRAAGACDGQGGPRTHAREIARSGRAKQARVAARMGTPV